MTDMKYIAATIAVAVICGRVAGEDMMKNIFKEVPYTEGRMGSRQLVNEKPLLVMQIALKPGQQVPLHKANSNVHLLVLEGDVIVTLDGREFPAPRGTLLPVAFQTPMTIRNDTDSNASFIVLKTPNPSEMSSSGISVREDQTVAELVVEHPELKEKLEKMGIDYCCGGKRPLGEAVRAAGIEWPAFVSKLQAEAKSSAQKDWNKVPVTELADHILNRHHTFMKEQLPRMDSLLTKVRSAHGENHGPMIDDLRRVFDSLRAEIEMHLMKEEQILFPAIKAVDAYVSGTGGVPEIHCGSVANPIRQMEYEHDSAGEALSEMRRITGNYTLPEDACQTFAALYDGLQAIEADLHEHIHLENNILFPRSVRQEKEMQEG